MIIDIKIIIKHMISWIEHLLNLGRVRVPGVVERRDKLRALLQECKMGKMVEKEISRLMEIVPRASPMSALETGLIVFSYWVSKAKKFALSLLKDDGVNHHFEVYPVVPELAGMVRTCPHVVRQGIYPACGWC